MKIAIESTEKITAIEGVPVRLWEGITDKGIPCKVFVHRIAVANSVGTAAAEDFNQELREMPVPVEPIPLRNIL